MFSIVIPVYKNEQSLPDLLDVLSSLAKNLRCSFHLPTEVVFVVDGSPDCSFDFLAQALPTACFRSKLLLHSRNFGSFVAIRTGLAAATGDYFGIMAADLQEPPELMEGFFGNLVANKCDVVVGCREDRKDPKVAGMASRLFWVLYRKLVIEDMPVKGVDVFACNTMFRDQLLKFTEVNSSLVGQIYWLGFRRREVYYSRRARKHGKSAWTFRKKIAYVLDSLFSFTDLPVRLLGLFGTAGVIFAVSMGLAVLVAKHVGEIEIPGYTATILTVIFFGGINTMGLGIIGSYLWRTYENTKHRPLALVMDSRTFHEKDGGGTEGKL